MQHDKRNVDFGVGQIHDQATRISDHNDCLELRKGQVSFIIKSHMFVQP